MIERESSSFFLDNLQIFINHVKCLYSYFQYRCKSATVYLFSTSVVIVYLVQKISSSVLWTYYLGFFIIFLTKIVLILNIFLVSLILCCAIILHKANFFFAFFLVIMLGLHRAFTIHFLSVIEF